MTGDRADIVAVAREAGVSISTVSRCFNHPDLVKASTRARVEDAVRRLGYIRNRAAQAMHGRRSGVIGLIAPTVDHTIFAELIQAFSEAVDAAGFTLLIATHGYDLDREYAVLRKLLEHRVDGVALIGPRANAKTGAMATPIPLPPGLLGLDATVARVETLRPDAPVPLSGGGAFRIWREMVEGAAKVVETTTDGWPAGA